jgi:tetratricopeptide (TPR) repeat protein
VTTSDDPSPLDYARIQGLLWQALQQPESDQDAWLHSQQVTDAERAEVSSLIKNHREAGTSFDHPIVGRVTDAGERMLKIAVAASIVVLAALVGGTTISLIFAWRAEQEAHAAELARGKEAAARSQAERAYRDADAARLAAQRDKLRMEAAFQFLMRDVFSKPFEQYGALGRMVTIVEALDLAAVGVADISDPYTEATVRTFFGQVYHDLGRPLAAIEQLRRAHELDEDLWDDDLAKRMSTLARLALAEQGAGNYEASRDLREEIFGQIESEGLTGEPFRAKALEAFATLQRDRGDYDGALEGHREAAAIFEQHFGAADFRTLKGQLGIATIHRLRGETRAVTSLIPNLIGTMLGMTPPPQELIFDAATELGSAFIQLGQLNDAQQLLEQALEIKRRLHEPNNPAVAYSLVALAALHHARRELDRAIELYEEAAGIHRSRFGEGHVYLPVCLWNLGSSLLSAEHFNEAAATLEESFELFVAAGMIGQPRVLDVVYALAQSYLQLGLNEQAFEALSGALASARAATPAVDTRLLATLEGRVESLRGAQ